MGRRAFIGGGLTALIGGAAYAAHRRRDQVERIVYQRVLARFRPETRTVRLADLDPAITYDVCIVGSGPAGATLATDLVDRGLSVVMLESGASWSSSEGGTAGELDRYRNVGPLEYPFGGTRARALGGTTAMWTGRAARFHPIDFEVNGLTPPGAPWPFSYADIEPYYVKAERTLRIMGGANPELRAPRSEPLPGYLPVRSELVPLLEHIEVVGETQPTSVSRWSDGPWRSHVDALPELSQSTLVTLVTRATATALHTDGAGTVTGATVRDLNGTTRTVKASRYVLACGGAENARLLMLSRSKSHPNGLGSRSGELGRNFMEHPEIELTATIPYKLDAEWGAAVSTHQFYDMLKDEGLGGLDLTVYWKNEPERNFVLRGLLEMEPSPENRLELTPASTDAFGNPGIQLSMGLSNRDLATRVRARGILADIMKRAGAVDIQELPMGWAHHHMGTTRAGDDPSNSVVDADMRLHDSPNLYLAGSSVFVTGGAGHPTVLLVALAHRLADHLTGRTSRTIA